MYLILNKRFVCFSRFYSYIENKRATMGSVMCGKGYRTWRGLFWYTGKHSDYIAQRKHHLNYVAQCKETYLQGGHYRNNGFLPLYHCNLVMRLGLDPICSGHHGSPIQRLSTIWTNYYLTVYKARFNESCLWYLNILSRKCSWYVSLHNTEHDELHKWDISMYSI